jgi:hypothetical protein
MQTEREQRLEQRRKMITLEDKFNTLSEEHSRSQQELTELRALINQLQTTITNQAQPDTTTKVTTFSANPFNSDINPSTSNGLKLFTAGTAPRKDKLNATLANSKPFLEAMRDDAADFGWGTLISNIIVNGVKKNILENFNDLDIDKVRLSMNPIFYHRTSTELPPTKNKPKMFAIDPLNNEEDRSIFYARVRANMIGMRIFNSLSDESKKSIRSKSALWNWMSEDGEQFYDGVTMLQILVTKVKPSTRVGLTDLKDKIRSAKLSSFSENVADMLDHMGDNYLEILKSSGSHEDYLMDLFTALLSTKNDVFKSFIQRQKDDWETGKDLDADELVATATEKYNNMVRQKTWKTSESSTSKIVALATQVKDLQDKLTKVSSTKPSSKESSGKSQFLEVAEWRKTKSFGDSVEKDGRQWHWCSIRHNNGKGMYVTHREEDHYLKYPAKNGSTSASNGSTDNAKKGTNKSMTLSDNLKAAMCAKFKCSSDDAAKLWADVAAKEQDF